MRKSYSMRKTTEYAHAQNSIKNGSLEFKKKKYNTVMPSKLTNILKFSDLNADCLSFIPHLTPDKVHMCAKYKVI